MKPKKFGKLHFILPVLFAINLIGNKASAQYYFYNDNYFESAVVLEAGLSGGFMNALTDVGGSKKGISNSGWLNDFTLKNTKLGGGFYLTGTYRDVLAARVEFNFGKVEAADSNLKGTTSKYAEGRYVRNLSFKTNVAEIAACLEFHPLFLKYYEDGDPPRLSPYVWGGISWVHYNPKAYLNGVWHDLRPLRLEGQGFSEYPDRKPYNKTTIAIPYGLGLRYEASEHFNFRFEMGYHKLFTDYLDDVSQENWVDPALFYKYLSPQEAALAVQLYNRSTIINPPHNTRPRGKSASNDAYWTVVFKVGISINRVRRY